MSKMFATFRTVPFTKTLFRALCSKDIKTNTNISGMMLKVVTPTKTLFNGLATQINVDTVDGSMGILYNHVPIVTVLLPSLLHIISPEGSTDVLVAGGTLTVSNNSNVCICASEAAYPSDIDRESLNQTVAHFKTMLEKSTEDAQKKYAQCALSALDFFNEKCSQKA